MVYISKNTLYIKVSTAKQAGRLTVNETDNILSIRHLYKSFPVDGREVEVLNDINFEIQRGDFIAIVGGSGCG